MENLCSFWFRCFTGYCTGVVVMVFHFYYLWFFFICVLGVTLKGRMGFVHEYQADCSGLSVCLSSCLHETKILWL